MLTDRRSGQGAQDDRLMAYPKLVTAALVNREAADKKPHRYTTYRLEENNNKDLVFFFFPVSPYKAINN